MGAFISLTVVLSLAVLFSVLGRRFKLPMVVSYLLAGVVASLSGLVSTDGLANLKFLPEIGLAFLLFLVGMEMNLSEFASFGKNVLLAGVSQVLISSSLLFFLLRGMGLELFPAVVAGVALSFSSTILVVRFLVDKKELASLQGKLAIGVLLLEDMVAVFLLTFLGLISAQHALSLLTVVVIVAKASFLIWLALFLGRRLLPRLFKIFASNTELLFLAAITWCLLFVAIASAMEVSLGVGAFLAGFSLAQSVYRVQISGRIKPLRDFFIMIFFVNLGLGVSGSSLVSSLQPAAIIAAYVVIVKPMIFFVLFDLLAFRVHSAFRTAAMLSSISEFCLIIIALAASFGLVSAGFVSIIILATVMSFLVSSLLTANRHRIYIFLERVLKPLERKKAFGFDFVPEQVEEFSDHAVLIGCDLSGGLVLTSLASIFGQEKVVVVDFNPDVVRTLRDRFIPCLYGDISDQEILERLNLKEAKLIVSTVRDLNDNLILLDFLEKCQSKALTIITATDNAEAITLYERGAHHVSMPLSLEGVAISQILNENKDGFAKLAAQREKKLGELKRVSNL